MKQKLEEINKFLKGKKRYLILGILAITVLNQRDKIKILKGANENLKFSNEGKLKTIEKLSYSLGKQNINNFKI